MLGAIVVAETLVCDFVARASHLRPGTVQVAAGVADRAAVATADMRKLPFDEVSFDAVLSSYAMDHLNGDSANLHRHSGERFWKGITRNQSVFSRRRSCPSPVPKSTMVESTAAGLVGEFRVPSWLSAAAPEPEVRRCETMPSVAALRPIIVLAILSHGQGPVMTALKAQTAGPAEGSHNILTYSTYLGGNSNDVVHAIAVDSQGNVYLAGETVSSDFPVTPGALQPKHGGKPGNDCSIFTGCYLSDAFVTKLDASGKIVYSTYLGGSSNDVAYGIAVDANGNAYIAGTTASPNFPLTAEAFESTPRSNSTHAFVAKLNASGSALVYSTLVGGSGSENNIAGIRIDEAGSAFVAGTTTSLDFPITPGAFQTTAAKASDSFNTLVHGFVFKLNAAGSALIYCTYLSGSQGASPQAMTLTSAGEVLVTGITSSPDFPITNGAYQMAIPPPAIPSNAAAARFVSRLDTGGGALVYSTFYAGIANTNFAGIEVDSAGAAYITGDTLGGFAETPGAFTGPATPSQYPATVYAVKLSPDGSRLVYAVPLIVGVGTAPGAVTVDGNGVVWLTGRTNASNFPITSDAYQSSYADAACFGGLVGPFAGSGDIVNCGDAYLAALDPSGSRLLYSTYFGSTGGEGGTALAMVPDGSVYLAGTTSSALLPATASAPETHRAFGPDCTYESSPSAYGANICTDVFLSRFGPAAYAGAPPFEVVNSASYLPEAVAPGELVTLFGPGIGGSPGLTYRDDGSGRVPTTLGAIRVLFDGVAAPLLYVGPNQINAIVPYDTAGKQQVPVVIERSGAAGPAASIELANVSPGFTVVAPGAFSMAASGIGQAAAFNNDDGTPNGPANPASAGSVVGMYVTGLGVTDQAVPDGTITDPSLLPKNIGTVEVFLGGKNAPVLYAGAAPYSPAGVSQVNFVIPAGVASGNQPVFVSAGHVEGSQSGVWIAVR
jgi:uncharacterized protein (TIGR03437 family)